VIGVPLRTPLCEQLGIRLPVIQAPIGSATSADLVAAVSNAGGLGMLSITWRSPEAVATEIRRTQDRTSSPFGVNVSLDFDIDQQLDTALTLGVPVASTFWGDPAGVHPQIAAAGALHLHTVRSAKEAQQAVAAGVDVVVAQGWEAGGHVLGEVATLPLIPAVVDAVAPVPVVAAGGIADGRGLAAVLVLGAQAGWLGTRFLASLEADAHDSYQARLVAATAEQTSLTTCFDGGWPNAAHRVLRNPTLDAWEAAGRPAAPDRPDEGAVIAHDDAGRTVTLYDDLMPLRHLRGDLDRLALYAGQSVGLVHDIQPASQLVTRIVDTAETALASLRTTR
jgi:NAD(P)H-dependent flavin oxidoreductase YrpB (nitropropane dioxygenase family)